MPMSPVHVDLLDTVALEAHVRDPGLRVVVVLHTVVNA